MASAALNRTCQLAGNAREASSEQVKPAGDLEAGDLVHQHCLDDHDDPSDKC